MKNLYILALSLLVIFNTAQAQSIEYDNTSKWFLGLNLGGTWSTTDVRDDLYAGWGLTLGKSFNYDYGRKMTFDLRARYLRGKWYGQDLSKTSLADYNPDNSVDAAQFPLMSYKDSGIVNNFEADVHRLGFELVLHANGIRERSGWDPYIFGGVGFTWYSTYGDLYYNDSLNSLSGSYNYTADNYSKTEISDIIDGVYDSPLVGSTADKFSVDFMPSLGIGLGYQIGKRTTFGIEHKTTFTLDDHFDGYVDQSSKIKNDLYHYTSLYLQFRFKVRGNTNVNTDINNVDNINNYNTNPNCDLPKVVFVNPSVNDQFSAGQSFLVSADLTNVINRDNITFLFNGSTNTNFVYNPANGRFESTVVLVNGSNTFEIKASNTCGNASNSISVNYQNCVNPIINWSSPSSNNTTVSVANFNLSALVQNSNNGQGITLAQNGRAITNVNFNGTTGALTSAVTLTPGANVFVLTVTNACGTATETITINFQSCVSPTITLSSPSVNNLAVTSPNFSLSALIQNSSNGQGVTLSQNGRAITNFTFNNTTGALTSNVTLNQGVNTFVISVANSCGTDTETITVNYQNCLVPTINWSAPSANNTTVTSANFNLSALIQNSNNGQGITLTNNGRGITNFSFNNATGSLSSNVTLTSGPNVFVITVANACGTDTETITVNYQNCIAPVASFVTPSANNSTVTSANFNLSALIQNSNNGQGITLTNNGRGITNFSFNNATGSLTSNVTLTPGPNVFVITVVNACGTDTETITVNYQNCVAPVASFVTPSANNTTVTSANFNLSALVQNSNNGQGITLTNNGRGITNFSFNNATGSLTSNVTLTSGPNVFVITVINACGTDTETITVNYQNCVAPAVSFVAPSANNTTVTSANFSLSALIQNSNNGQGITLTNNGRGITNFSFNNATGALTSNVTLVPGANVFVITVTNACGTDTETITVNYQNCVAPAVSFVTPAANNTTVTSASFSLSALVQNSVIGQTINLTKNGISIADYTFNNATGVLTSTVPLAPGANVFVLTVTNSCGTDTETITVNYQNCVAPTVSFVAPSANNTTVTSANFNLSALVQNSNNGQGITLTNNGRGITTFSVNNATGALTSNVTLIPGANVFVITVTNACGTDTETITVNYQNCIAPTVTFINPASSPLTVTSPNYNLSATVLNSNNGEGITATQNGKLITSGSFNPANGSLTGSVVLSPGANVFVVTVTNACGTDTETVTIFYEAEEENNSNPEQMITICHIPPGNNSNPQTIQIPLSAWPAHQAHGDVLGSCVVEEEPTEENNGGQSEQKITICHIPPGNNGNPQTIEIPLSAWPAHQAHGDVLGACIEEEPAQENNGGQSEQKITICHIPPGNNGNPQTIEIPLSAWPAHQAHGDVLGPCVEEPAGNDNNGQGSNSNNNSNSNGSGFGGIGNAGSGSGSSNGNSGNGGNGSNGEGANGESGGGSNGSNGGGGNKSTNQPKEPQIVKPKVVTPKGGTTPASKPKPPVKEPVKEVEPEEKGKEKEVPVEEVLPPPPLKGKGGK